MFDFWAVLSISFMLTVSVAIVDSLMCCHAVITVFAQEIY